MIEHLGLGLAFTSETTIEQACFLLLSSLAMSMKVCLTLIFREKEPLQYRAHLAKSFCIGSHCNRRPPVFLSFRRKLTIVGAYKSRENTRWKAKSLEVQDKFIRTISVDELKQKRISEQKWYSL